MVLSKQECWEYLRSSWLRAENRDQCQATLLPSQVPTHRRILAEGVPDQKRIPTDSCLIDPVAIKPITFAHWSGTNSLGITTSVIKRPGFFDCERTGNKQGFSGIEALQGWTLDHTTNEEIRKRKERVEHILRNSSVLENFPAIGYEQLKTLLERHLMNAPNPDDTHKIVSELVRDISEQQQTRQKDDDENINASFASLNAVWMANGKDPLQLHGTSDLYQSSSENEESSSQVSSTSTSGSMDSQLAAFCDEETTPQKVWMVNGRDPLQLHGVSDMNNFHQSSSEDEERSSQASISGENQIHVDSVSDNDTSDELPYNQESTRRMCNDEIRGHYESTRVPQQQTGVRVAHSSNAKIIDPVDRASLPDAYMEEIRRRATFNNFLARHHGRSLSVFWKSGFFYTGVADQVQCGFCNRIVENWGPEDDPSDLCWHRSTCRRRQERNEQTERQNNEQLSRSCFNGCDAANTTQTHQLFAAATPTRDEVCSEDGGEDDGTSLLTNHGPPGSLPRTVTPTDSCSSSEDHGTKNQNLKVTGQYSNFEVKNCKDFQIYNCPNSADSINNNTKEIKKLRMTLVAVMLVYGSLFFWKKIKQSSSF